MNTYLKAMLMPMWTDCPWDIPPGVEVHRDGEIIAMIAGGRSVGLRFSSFDPKNLPEIFSRLGVRNAPSRA